MKAHEIESLARNIIDRVTAGQRVEDVRYELKADWPDPYDAALRIAGHGNAAQGEAVLWLIGVDEDRGIVTGAGTADVANWYPRVEKYFDGHAPEMRSVSFSASSLPVVAILFETERAPFVVKNPKGGYPEFSVPWRGETRLRAAKRDELLRILSPLRRVPSLSVVGAAVGVGTPQRTRNQIGVTKQLWRAVVKVFAELKDDKRVIIPFHRCKGQLSFIPHQNFNHAFTRIVMSPASAKSQTIITTEDEVTLDGSGTLLLTGQFMLDDNGWRPGGDARVTFDIYPVGSDQPVGIDMMVPLSLDLKRWEWGDPVMLFDEVTVITRG